MSPGVQAIRGPKRDVTIHIRVTKAERCQFLEKGGGKWVRGLLRAARLKKESRKEFWKKYCETQHEIRRSE